MNVRPYWDAQFLLTPYSAGWKYLEVVGCRIQVNDADFFKAYNETDS